MRTSCHRQKCIWSRCEDLELRRRVPSNMRTSETIGSGGALAHLISVILGIWPISWRSGKLDAIHVQSDVKEELSDGSKSGFLVDVVPQDMKEYLSTKMEHDGTDNNVKEHIIRFVQTTPAQGKAPMDVDRVGFQESPENNMSMKRPWSQRERAPGKKRPRRSMEIVISAASRISSLDVPRRRWHALLPLQPTRRLTQPVRCERS